MKSKPPMPAAMFADMPIARRVSTIPPIMRTSPSASVRLTIASASKTPDFMIFTFTASAAPSSLRLADVVRAGDRLVDRDKEAGSPSHLGQRVPVPGRDGLLEQRDVRTGGFRGEAHRLVDGEAAVGVDEDASVRTRGADREDAGDVTIDIAAADLHLERAERRERPRLALCVVDAARRDRDVGHELVLGAAEERVQRPPRKTCARVEDGGLDRAGGRGGPAARRTHVFANGVVVVEVGAFEAWRRERARGEDLLLRLAVERGERSSLAPPTEAPVDDELHEDVLRLDLGAPGDAEGLLHRDVELAGGEREDARAGGQGRQSCRQDASGGKQARLNTVRPFVAIAAVGRCSSCGVVVFVPLREECRVQLCGVDSLRMSENGDGIRDSSSSCNSLSNNRSRH